MITKKLFLASSSELKEDRKEFEIFIGRKNKDWVSRGGFLELNVWEDFLDAMSKTRLQDEYNEAIRQCDVFIMLFCTKVGQYTEEEFETAFGQFKVTNKPLIFTYFKDAEISTGSVNKKDMESVWAFKEKLDALGHFYRHRSCRSATPTRSSMPRFRLKRRQAVVPNFRRQRGAASASRARLQSRQFPAQGLVWY
jgi:hypothetical protein